MFKHLLVPMLADLLRILPMSYDGFGDPLAAQIHALAASSKS